MLPFRIIPYDTILAIRVGDAVHFVVRRGPFDPVGYAAGSLPLVTVTLLAGSVPRSSLHDGLTELLGSSGHRVVQQHDGAGGR